MSSSTSATTLSRSLYSGSSSSGSTATENLPPRTLARLAREVRDLVMAVNNNNSTDDGQQQPPPAAAALEGIRLVVDPDSGLPSNLGELMAELIGPQGTPYEQKSFLLKLVFPRDYPNSPPRGFFLTKLYHPNVCPQTGAICVNTLKRDWTSTTTLQHVLQVIRCLLIVPFPESSLNDEAGKLFMDSYDEYAKRARLMADVHGRSVVTTSAAENNSAADPQQKTKSVSSTARGVLKSADNPNNHQNHNSSSSSSAMVHQKKANKKKSLKRL